MINLAILDDDTNILNILNEMICSHYNEQISVSLYQDPKNLLAKYKKAKTEVYDIIITDIVLNDESGINLAKKIQSLSRYVKIIFITAHLTLAPDIFKSDPVYLVSKPVNPDKLFAAIDKALEKIRLEEEQILVLESKKGLYRVNSNYIKYVESHNRSLSIHHNGSVIILNMRLNDLQKKLGNRFIRCHQSYLVNIDFIEQVNSHEIELVDGTAIPVSRNKVGMTKQQIKLYLNELVV